MNDDPGRKDTAPPDDARREEEAPPAGEGGAAAPPAAGAPAGPSAEDLAALEDRWLRAEAELQNYRRRAAREREEARQAAEESVMLEIVAALDDLERAQAAGASASSEPWVAGVRLVMSRLTDFLARQGVTVVDPVGAPFDPALHEAILEVESSDAEPGRVTQVVLKGWRRGARALRAARVVVARAPAERP